MKLIKNIFFFSLLSAMSCTSSAQKQTFDVITYLVPTGWQQQKNEAGVQLSVTDKKTGAYAIALITKATGSGATANENFNNDWNRLLKGTVQIDGEPAMQEPANENGWDIISGGANYKDGSTTGMATLLTATGGGQMVSVVLMTNTAKYQNELLSFINSLELAKASQNDVANSTTATGQANNNSSIVGLWVYYTIETSGYYNGFPQPSGGYFRKEYAFYGDGTYLFRMKNWAVFVKEIQYVYETGTWKLNGNKLTITPKQGKGGWWSKAASGRTNEWGSLVKTGSWKLEPVTYTIDLHYYSGVNETHLILQSASQTEREGKQENNMQTYSPREIGKSLIDDPPGIKTGFENKSFSATSQNNKPMEPVSSMNSPIAGKVWEGTSAEKFISGSMSGYNTGGYFTYQYKFNTNGTYRFIYIGASAYIQPNLLQYETGTYSVSGNKLTIVPTSGFNEEWSVIGGPINLAGMSDVSIGNIKHNWGKRIKTEKRTLEKVTYTISTEYWAGNKTNALKLEWDGGKTVREGNGNFTYYLETTDEKSTKLPAGIK